MSTVLGRIYGNHQLAKNLKPFHDFIRNLHKETIKVSWEKPEIGWIKLNFDGSCKWETGKASIGGIVRDHNAKFLLGYAESIAKTNSTIAEFAALRQGLKLVLEHDYTQLHIEGDYKTLVEIIRNKRDVKCVEVQKYVTSINLILQEFRKYYVTHVYRQGNRVAHNFAQIGYQSKRPRVWHLPPTEVSKIVNEDANGTVIRRLR